MVYHQTVYRYDYKDPKSYDSYVEEAKNIERKTDKCVKDCDCTNGKYQSNSTNSKSIDKKGKGEWTGIGVNGRQLIPKIIPEKNEITFVDGYDIHTKDNSEDKCIEDDPRHFIHILKKCYPDLYKRLKIMQEADIKKKIDKIHYKSTYQMDYPDYSKPIENIKLYSDECSKFQKEPLTKPKIKKTTGCQKAIEATKNKISDNPTPPYDKPPPIINFQQPVIISEYRDSISRNGCLIIKNKIHDHVKCAGRECVHRLKYACQQYS